jgi:putative tricarboxylic transport membrane protein
MTLGRDGIVGLVCLAISVWLLALTIGLPPAAFVPIGPAFYPRVVLGLMALLSAILLVGDVLAGRRRRVASIAPAVAEEAAGAPPNYPLVIASFVVFGLYILLLPYLGFRIATFLFVIALQAALEWPRSWKRWLLVVVIAAATTIGCVLAFEVYLSVLLPRGSWTAM